SDARPYDEALAAAVARFQAACGLRPDGVVGPATWRRLLEDRLGPAGRCRGAGPETPPSPGEEAAPWAPPAGDAASPWAPAAGAVRSRLAGGAPPHPPLAASGHRWGGRPRVVVSGGRRTGRLAHTGGPLRGQRADPPPGPAPGHPLESPAARRLLHPRHG